MVLGSLSSIVKAADKQLHALGSFALTLAVFLLLLPKNIYIAAVVAPLVSAGIAYLKERHDAKLTDSSLDYLDLVADLVGILAALALIIYVCVCSR